MQVGDDLNKLNFKFARKVQNVHLLKASVYVLLGIPN